MIERYRVPPNVHSRRFADELVILDLSRGVYYSLEGSGVDIWERLVAGDPPAQVLEQLGRLYDVSEKVLRADIERLIRELTGLGLLALHDGDEGTR